MQRCKDFSLSNQIQTYIKRITHSFIHSHYEQIWPSQECKGNLTLTKNQCGS